MSQKSSFTIVIPCYNEEKAIDLFITELEQFLIFFRQSEPQITLNVIIVDNNSTDASLNLLKSKNLDSAVQILSCLTQGYGAALKHGFNSASSDYYAFADLDNTYPLIDLLAMYKLMRVKNADMVLGSRLHPQSEIPWLRRQGNTFYRKIANYLFSSEISDSCSGMRIFSHKVKDEVLKLSRTDLSFSIELTAQALARNWSLLEYPISYRDRIGSSKLSVFQDGFKFLYVLMRVRFFG